MPGAAIIPCRSDQAGPLWRGSGGNRRAVDQQGGVFGANNLGGGSAMLSVGGSGSPTLSHVIVRNRVRAQREVCGK
jgi:hypothetical protein